MEHGFPVLNLYVVVHNYLKSWFLTDLLSSVPFSSLPINGPWAAFRLLKAHRPPLNPPPLAPIPSTPSTPFTPFTLFTPVTHPRSSLPYR